MNNQLLQNRSIYRIKNTGLFLAVDNQYAREIRECLIEYRSLDKIPVYRSVKGFVFKILNENLSELLYNGAETEYAMSSLEFETGNVRLTA